MKILFCIKAMNNSGGGAQRVLADVAGGIVDRGHEVAVLSFDQAGGQSFYSLHPKILRTELGIGSTTESAGVLDTLRRIVALRASVCDYAPNVVIGFMHSMFIPLGLSLLGTSIPVIASEHIGYEYYQYYRPRLMDALLWRLTPLLTTRIICVSEQVLQAYPPPFQRKMIAIPNPVSMRSCGRADVSGSQKSRKVLLAVGRLAYQKDYKTLIQAFAMLAGRLPKWTLRIVGEGALRKQLQTQIFALGLDNRVELAGDTKEVMKEYVSAQLFVSSSRFESFSLVTAEALAHGLPVVGFADCAGVNQLVRSGENGALAGARGDRAEALAATLEPIMAEDTRRIALARNIDGLPAEYSLNNVINRWEKVIQHPNC